MRRVKVLGKWRQFYTTKGLNKPKELPCHLICGAAEDGTSGLMEGWGIRVRSRVDGPIGGRGTGAGNGMDEQIDGWTLIFLLGRKCAVGGGWTALLLRDGTSKALVVWENTFPCATGIAWSADWRMNKYQRSLIKIVHRNLK